MEWIEPVTDRQQSDIQDKTQKGYANTRDFNRLENNCGVLSNLFSLGLQVKTDWQRKDFPTEANQRRIVENVKKIRDAFPVSENPEPPSYPLTAWQKWNAAETILLNVYRGYIQFMDSIPRSGGSVFRRSDRSDLMAYSKKTWADRQVEHPGRRKLTSTGTTDVYDVTREEGLVIEEGDALNASTFNDLENRIYTAFNEASIREVYTLTHQKSSNVHQLTGLTGVTGTVSCVFTATAAFTAGDTFTVDGTPYTIQLSNGETAEDNLFVTGAAVPLIVDTGAKKVNFKSGGGLSASKLALATAAAADVLSGKTFYAGDKEIKTGSLQKGSTRVSGSVTVDTDYTTMKKTVTLSGTIQTLIGTYSAWSQSPMYYCFFDKTINITRNPHNYEYPNLQYLEIHLRLIILVGTQIILFNI